MPNTCSAMIKRRYWNRGDLPAQTKPETWASAVVSQSPDPETQAPQAKSNLAFIPAGDHLLWPLIRRPKKGESPAR